MIVNLPVECYGKCCMNCPELEIDIITNEKYDMEMVENGVTKVTKAKYSNKLRCPHVERCKVIFENGKNGNNVITKTVNSKASKTSTKAPVKKITTKTPAKTTKKTVKDK